MMLDDDDDDNVTVLILFLMEIDCWMVFYDNINFPTMMKKMVKVII